MKTALFGLASIVLLVATGCSDPCAEVKDCCVALAEAAGVDGSAAGCDAYDNADADACDAVKDTFKAAADAAGVDLPAECEF